jgi:putative glutamine amidotransferase
MYKVYASADYVGYTQPLLDTGKWQLVYDIGQADVVLFAGGADIQPMLYKQPMGRYTYCSPRRDQIEVADYNYAKLSGIPMVGVCRGMQLLTALEGGSLFQHVDNHAGYRHEMVTDDGSVLLVNSLHHQMCNPWDGVEEFKLLGWAPEPSAGTIIGAGDKAVAPPPVEPEAIYYPNSNAFAVQWHPEMMSMRKPTDAIAINWFTNHVEMLVEGLLQAA